LRFGLDRFCPQFAKLGANYQMRETSDRIAANWSTNLIVPFLLALTCTFSCAQAPLTFSPTGSLNTGRNSHRAIALNDGTVLITGGYDYDGGAVGSSELYDPATGIFTVTGSLNTARRNCGITLLDNGTVLVTGGYDNALNVLASAEIYDPATRVFNATGNLATARADATATRLEDGTVLIAGGFDNTGNPLSSAELYTRSTGTFVATGSLNSARGFSTATALIDGTVLITGGWGVNAFSSGGALASAELYDPATNSFSVTGSLNVGRVRGTATLLNGGIVLIAGGEDISNNILANAELYDPNLKAFTKTGSLSTARGDHAATLMTNGTVLVEGGFACQPSNCSASAVDMSASAEIYDPTSGSFNATGSLATARQVHTSTLLTNGTILVAAGWSNFDYILTSAEVYDPGTLAPNNLVSISLSPLDPCLPVGTSQAITATGTFSDSSTQTLVSAIWGSSDRTIATVTNDSGSNSGMTNDSTNSGVVFGVNLGSATLNACTGLICGSTSVAVSPACGGGISTASVSPSSVRFSASVVGVSSSAQTITVTNTGSQTLSFSGIGVSGDFTTTNSACRSVPVGGNCAVQVTFTPTSPGPRTGTVSFSDSAVDSPQTVTLNGSGIDFGFSATNPSATVTPSGAAVYQLSVNSVGGSFPGSVNLTCSNLPSFATCTANPASLTPGSGSSSVTVTVTTGPNAVLIASRNARHPVMAWLPLSQGLGIFGFFVLGKDGQRKRRAYFVGVVVLLIAILLLNGCGGGVPSQPSSPPHATPEGSYSLLLTGKSGSLEHVFTLTLNVQ
jgi:hypothetical protein